jgi:hypothetical protein
MLKSISRHWQWRRERFYQKNRWHLILDFSLGIIVILLAAILITLYFYHPDFGQLFSRPLPAKTELDLNNPPLVFNFSATSSAVRLADGINLKINLKNNSNLLSQDIKTDFVLLAKNFTIDKIENTNKNPEVKINNQEINFGALSAGESREVLLKINFKSQDESTRVIKWQAKNEYSVQGQVIKSESDLADINLAAELKGSAVIFYNSPQGDQLGSGPLPPLVGLPTNYWVFFEINSNGDFKDLVFSAKLPLGVELTNKRSLLSGDFKYNAATRQVVWTVPELKNQSDSYRVGFEIQLLPTAAQVGKVVPLLTNIKYYASDILVKTENYAELPVLDTNLDYDQLNKGQGEISQP